MNQSSRTKNSILNMLSSVGSELFLTGLKFICRTVFIATLGKQYLGINGLFADILSMLSITELGLDMAINYKLYKPIKENDIPRIRVLLKFYKNAYRVIGFVIMALGVALLPFLPNIIKDYDKLGTLGINPELIFMLFLLQSVSSYLFFAYRAAIIKADQKSYIIFLTSMLGTAVLNIVQIIVLIFFKDFVLYTALAVLSNLGINLLNAVIAKKHYPEVFEKTEESLSKEEIREIFKDMGALFLYRVNVVVIKSTDNLVLSYFLGLSVVGMYSNYLLIYTTIKSFLQKIYTATKASMGNLFASENIEKKYRFFEITNFATALLYGTAGIGITVVGNELIGYWLGSDYVIAQPFPLLIGIEIYCLGNKNQLAQVREISGIFRQIWYRPLLAMTVNLVVSIVLVQYWGIYGVIIGTVTSDLTVYFMIDPYYIYKYSLESFRPLREYYIRNVTYIIVLAAIGILDYTVCTRFLTGYGWLSILMHTCICGMSVPLGFLLIFRKRHECRYIIETAERGGRVFLARLRK